jgi:hypothetical protein
MLLAILAIGLALFFAISAGLPDGLEKTMELGDVEEGEPYHDAPLDYGSDYPTSLAMGALGLTLVLLLILGFAIIVRNRNART